jgi:hypothetical protein
MLRLLAPCFALWTISACILCVDEMFNKKKHPTTEKMDLCRLHDFQRDVFGVVESRPSPSL